MHQGLTARPRPISSTQLGQKTHTVLGRTRRQALPQNISQRRQHIQLAHQARTRRSGRHHRGPSDQKRHPMTSLEQVGLVTAVTSTRIVPKSPQLAEIGRRRTTIVRRENHQCIPRNPERIELIENVSHRRIHLHHEITVRIGSRPPDEFRSGNSRRVRRSQGQVEEKRRTVRRPGACPRLDPRQRLLPKPRMNLLMPEIRPDHPRPPHLRPRTRRNPVTRHRRRSILTQVHERGHVQGGADSEEPVKSMSQGAAPERLTEIHILQFLTRAHPIHTQVPLPHHAGRITLPLQKPRHRQPPRLDQAWIIAVQHTRLEFPPP